MLVGTARLAALLLRLRLLGLATTATPAVVFLFLVLEVFFKFVKALGLGLIGGDFIEAVVGG
jgi:hypothetical protein